MQLEEHRSYLLLDKEIGCLSLKREDKVVGDKIRLQDLKDEVALKIK